MVISIVPGSSVVSTLSLRRAQAGTYFEEVPARVNRRSTFSPCQRLGLGSGGIGHGRSTCSNQKTSLDQRPGTLFPRVLARRNRIG